MVTKTESLTKEVQNLLFFEIVEYPKAIECYWLVCTPVFVL